MHQAIIQEAQEGHCDLICMASHGRKGIAGICWGAKPARTGQ
ncbi:universal stress protein [Staphylococcus epidermidis]|nr:universal stress protein [Staphylococcus epidermidis]